MAIVDASTGLPSSTHVQTINNSFANIQATITALQQQETSTAALAQQLSDTVAQLLVIEGLVQDVNGKLVSLSIVNSYTTPANVLTATTGATTATIAIAAHTRVYGDGTTVAVSGGTLTGLTPSTTYYVYYSDPNRAGGAVNYQDSTTSTDAAQIGGVHSVGSVMTPAAGATTSTPGTGGGAPGVPSGGGGRGAAEV